MLLSYPAIYNDKFGKEETYIHNDGRHLWMNVRSILFRGKMLDDWGPVDKTTEDVPDSFTFNRNELCEFSLIFSVPLTIVHYSQHTNLALRINIEIGGVNERGLITYVRLRLSCEIDLIEYHSRKSYEWFEDALNDLQAQLPTEYLLCTCINCAYSDYSPAGHGMFGCLACFRDCKDEYLKRKGKAAFFDLQDAITEVVQEIHVCPEFERRKPSTGYRG